MKMDATFKPELLVSDDETQVALCCLRFDGENLMATNGHAGVLVPVTADKGDEPATIPVHVFKWARSWSKGLKDILSLLTHPAEWKIGVQQGDLFNDQTAIIPRDPQKERSAAYPDLRALLMDAAERNTGGVTLCVNAALLSRLQQAMGATGVSLKFQIAEGRVVDSSITVRPLDGSGTEQALGLIMPMRIKV